MHDWCSNTVWQLEHYAAVCVMYCELAASMLHRRKLSVITHCGLVYGLLCAGSAGNRHYLRRNSSAPTLLVIHIADGQWKDQESARFTTQDPLAAVKPVPLLHLFTAKTGSRVLMRGDRPFTPLTVARAYAYRRVLHKLMEQGRLFIRNPFIRQV